MFILVPKLSVTSDFCGDYSYSEKTTDEDFVVVLNTHKEASLNVHIKQEKCDKSFALWQ